MSDEKLDVTYDDDHKNENFFNSAGYVHTGAAAGEG